MKVQTNLLEQLKKGKKIKVKHNEYAFTIHVELKMDDNGKEPSINIKRVNLSQQATKEAKYLLKLANIYCFDVMCNNLLNYVLESPEYKKILFGLRNKNDNAAIDRQHHVQQIRR